jgi:LysM repeat protein
MEGGGVVLDRVGGMTVGGATEVTLRIFSGRPNPVWNLSPAENQELRRRLKALPPTTQASGPEAGLGYSGFGLRLLDAEEELEQQVEVWKGVAQVKDRNEIVVLSDTDRALERWLLDTAAGRVADQVVETARQEIELSWPAGATSGPPLASTEAFTSTALGLVLNYPAGWEIYDQLAGTLMRFRARDTQTEVLSIVRYPAVVNSETLSATHTVQAGDTLLSIATQYGTNVDALLAANGFLKEDDLRDLRVGQSLLIPTRTRTTLDTVLDNVLQGGESSRVLYTRTLVIDAQPAVQVFLGPAEEGRYDTIVLAADPTGGWWTINGRGDLWLFEQVVRTLRWLPENEAEDELFGIYLVDSQASPHEVQQMNLSALDLAETPILSAADIVTYDANTHEFQLTEAAYARIGALEVPVQGVPFVVVAGGERIYSGAFWVAYSSLSFEGIVIETLPALTGRADRTLRIQLAYPESRDLFTGQDLRADPRVLRALEAAGSLD